MRLDRFEANWRTVDPVPLDVRLLTGETRLRVRLRTQENHRCWRPKTSWNVQGLAVMVRDDQSWERPNWEVWGDPNKPLNCARGRILARVFFSRNRSSFEIFEGSRFVTKGTRPFQLSGLVARGAPLVTRDGVELAASVEDQGCVLRFYGRMLRQNHCCVVLRDRIEPCENHTIILWTTGGQVRTIKPSGHRVQDRRWGPTTLRRARSLGDSIRRKMHRQRLANRKTNNLGVTSAELKHIRIAALVQGSGARSRHAGAGSRGD